MASTSNLPTPPIPARPNQNQYLTNAGPRYSPFVQPSPYYGMGPAGHPYGLPLLTNAHQQIDATFQSIQSIVQAFSSISVMLESTYMAVHSSFRAVIDLADHFARLKDGLSGILSLTAMFNTIKWFYNRVLYMFNLVNQDQVWSDSLMAASSAIERGQKSILEHGKQQSSWPLVLFLGAAVGAPYLIYQFQKPSGTSNEWITRKESHYVAEALYNFDTDREGEVPLKAGQTVIVAPKEQQPQVQDWLLATTDGKKAGLIPMNYIKIIKFEIIE